MQDQMTDALVPASERHDEYYFSLVTFQVENKLFRVPRYAFEEHSRVFRDIFSVSTCKEEGTGDTNPIYLQGTNERDFTSFLKVLYPRTYSTMHNENTCVLYWWAVLRLAHVWEFHSVRQLAISKLDACILDPTSVWKVALMEKYDIREWRIPTYAALIKRRNPLTSREAQLLGFEVATTIALFREAYLSYKLKCRSAPNPYMTESELGIEDDQDEESWLKSHLNSYFDESGAKEGHSDNTSTSTFHSKHEKSERAVEKAFESLKL